MLPKKRVRSQLSCAECRRLKLKCDRVWPCSSCTKRGCQDICPTKTLQPLGRVSPWAKRVEELEGIMTSAGLADLIPPSFPGVGRRTGQEVDGEDPGEQEESLVLGLGSLSINEDGSTRFLGSSAGSAYFESAQTPGGEYEDSETSAEVTNGNDGPTPPPIAANYPFTNSGSTYPISNSVSRSKELEQIRGYLPPQAESEQLARNYWSYVAFCSEPITESDFWDDYMVSAYTDNDPHGGKLACVLVILSLGALFDRSSPSTHNAIANQYFLLSQNALAASRFLSIQTIPGIQALQLSGTFLFNTHRLQDAGETFFSLLGLAMRQVGAMGLHRDGSKFGVVGPELERRRLIFYELLALDRHQSFISGRPYLMSAGQFDTQVPSDACEYQVNKWKLSIFLGRVIDDAFSVKPPTYAILLGLDQDLRDLAKASPSSLRSGVLPDNAFVTRPVGAPTLPPTYSSTATLKDQMRHHTIDVLFAQILLYLHRPAFSQALLHYADEPMNSPWASSVKAVCLEAGVYIVAIAGNWIRLDPVLCPRWWHIFFHAFAASVAQASLVIKSPRSMLSQHAWAQLNIACKTFEFASTGGAPVAKLLPRLQALREKAYASLQGVLVIPSGVREGTAADDSESVLGPTTRLSRKPMRARPTGSSHSLPSQSPPMLATFITTPPIPSTSRSRDQDYSPPYGSTLDYGFPTATQAIPRNFQQEYRLSYSESMRNSSTFGPPPFGFAPIEPPHFQAQPTIPAVHYPNPRPTKNYDHLSSILPPSYFSAPTAAGPSHSDPSTSDLRQPPLPSARPSSRHSQPQPQPQPQPQYHSTYSRPRMEPPQQTHEQQPPPPTPHELLQHRQLSLASIAYNALPNNYVPGPAWGGALAYPVMPPPTFEGRADNDDEHWGMWEEMVDQ